MSKKDKRLYNYVVNTLGISKKLIMDYVDSRIEDLFSKIDYDYIHNYCKKEVHRRLDARIVRDIEWDLEKKVEKEVSKHLKKIKMSGKITVDYKPEIDITIDMKKEI